MTEKEYQDAFKELMLKYENAKKELDKEFALSHNPVKIGDWVGDNCNYIRVEKMKISLRWTDIFPCLTYYGKTCKKDGTPRVHPKPEKVHQSNLLFVNGKFIENHGYGEE